MYSSTLPFLDFVSNMHGPGRDENNIAGVAPWLPLLRFDTISKLPPTLGVKFSKMRFHPWYISGFRDDAIGWRQACAPNREPKPLVLASSAASEHGSPPFVFSSLVWVWAGPHRLSRRFANAPANSTLPCGHPDNVTNGGAPFTFIQWGVRME